MKQPSSLKKTAARALAAVASFLLIFALLFTALQLSVNNRGWFEREYEKMELSSSIGISTDDITDALMRLIDYMEGRVDSIRLTVEENGVPVEMYNERETAHMEDVRALYQFWRGVRTYGALTAAVLLVIAFLLDPRGFLFDLSRGFLRASAVFGLLAAALAAFALLDFTSFWNSFHHLFFSNDLWLLNPATDRMIRICPEQLFSDIVMRFGLNFLLIFAALFAAAAVIRGQEGRRAHGE